MNRNFKRIVIVVLIICLLATVITADARHYSTLNHNQHVIHPVHHSYFNGNHPPNRNPISDQEVRVLEDIIWMIREMSDSFHSI